MTLEAIDDNGNIKQLKSTSDGVLYTSSSGGSSSSEVKVTDGTDIAGVKPATSMEGTEPGLITDSEISASVPIMAGGSTDGSTMDSSHFAPHYVDSNKNLHVVNDEALSEAFDADISSTALSAVSTGTGGRKLKAIMFHFDTSYSGTITITLDDANGANYDTVLLTDIVSGITNYVWYPSADIPMVSGDQIKVEATIQASTHVYGTVRYQRSG